MSVNEEGLTTTAGSCIAAGEGEVGRHAVTGEAPGPFVGQKLGGIPGCQGCPFKVRSGEEEVVWTVWSKAVLVQLGWADPLEMKAGDVVFCGRVLWHADLMGRQSMIVGRLGSQPRTRPGLLMSGKVHKQAAE